MNRLEKNLQKVSAGAIPTISTGKFGMWIFLVSEIMFFAGLVGSYIVLRLGSGSWPDPAEILNVPLLSFNTFILITSSLTMALAVDAIQNDNRHKTISYLWLTTLLGSAFLIIKIYDYIHMWKQGFTVASSLFGSSYYLLTAFHGLHVLSGLILLLNLISGTHNGRYSSTSYDRIECAGLYWHFVDLVWVFLFAGLCLV